MAQGLMAITLSRFLCQGSVHLLQPVLAPTILIFHPQDISLSLAMGITPTKDTIMNRIMHQALAIQAETTLILPTVSKFTLIPGSVKLGMLLLHLGVRTLLGCIQSVVPRRLTSQILSQPPAHHHCRQRVGTLGLWELHLSPHHSAQKMSWST